MSVRSERATLSTINMTLAVWRVRDGELQHEPLWLTGKVDDATLEDYEPAFLDNYCLVRVAARLLMNAAVGDPQGWIEGSPEIIADEELARQAARLRSEDPFSAGTD